MKKFTLALLGLFMIGVIALPRTKDEKYVGVVDKVLPAVVEIHVSGDMKADPEENVGVDHHANILGAGTYIRPNGYILTVAHLFNGFSKIDSVTVIDQSGDEVAAKVKLVSTKVDLALIKVDFYQTTPYVTIADPRTLKVGQEVIAIGSPLGLAFSVSNGIISNLYMDFKNAYNVTQSNTAINPGNSGGPLFNLQGELVGVNSFFIFDRFPVFTGLGFSVQSGQCLEFITRAQKRFPDMKIKTVGEVLFGGTTYAHKS